MKKILLIILALMLYCTPAFAGSSGGKLVATYAAADARVSYQDGNCFFWINGQDLSAYADPRYRFEIVDAEGDLLKGVGLSVGGGETVGPDLVTDGGMASYTATNVYTSNFSAGVDGHTAVADITMDGNV